MPECSLRSGWLAFYPAPTWVCVVVLVGRPLPKSGGMPGEGGHVLYFAAENSGESAASIGVTFARAAAVRCLSDFTVPLLRLW